MTPEERGIILGLVFVALVIYILIVSTIRFISG